MAEPTLTPAPETTERAGVRARGAGRAKPASAPRSRRAPTFLIQTAIVALFLALWEIGSRSGVLDPLLFGSPSGVWTALGEYLTNERAWQSLAATAQAVIITFVLGSILGTVVGLLMGLFRPLDTVLGPFLVPLNSIPRIALAPVFIAWFGLTGTAKIVLGISIVFFVLAENSRGAVRSVDRDVLVMARVVGLRGPSLLGKVVLPAVVPTMFAGLRLAYTYSVLGVVASEMIAAVRGIGQDIVLYSTSYQINTVFAILFIIMVIAVVISAGFAVTEKRLLRWQNS
jgi:NitT/TauT family transport system permease protein